MNRLGLLAVMMALAGCAPLLALADRSASSVPSQIVQFASSVDEVSAETLGHSWRPGCPVPVEDLRLVSVTHWGFDENPHQGELVVHVEHADSIVDVMERLFVDHFPIERMELVGNFGGDDDRSMAANNSSALNCREVSRRPGVWSQHAYGTAIDINPVQNPYILSDGTALPPGALTDRMVEVPGLIRERSLVVEAFETIGWLWGGAWAGPKDYQHFSANGR